MKTGNTGRKSADRRCPGRASMEPGHEDREYLLRPGRGLVRGVRPQWSPVMKTGNTRHRPRLRRRRRARLNGARS